MRRIDLRVDRNRLLCNVCIFRPDRWTDMTSFAGRGLIDTGATTSGIGPSVIAELGLQAYGKKPLGSATEERMVDYYLFQIGLDESDSADGPAWPHLFDRTDGFSWRRQTEFDVIVGMDVLRRCDLDLRRDGSWSLRFG